MKNIKKYAVIMAAVMFILTLMAACSCEPAPGPSATLPLNSASPSADMTGDPSVSPTVDQSVEPSVDPSAVQSAEPTAAGTPATSESLNPTSTPKATATSKPTQAATPTPAPTIAPTPTPAKDPDIPAFSTTDLNGNTVTNEVFKNAPMTMINVWATWCAPCIEELPYIQELSTAFSGRMQVISILFDSSDPGATDEAATIITATGVRFPVLKNNKSVREAITEKFNMNTLPTTLFVDSNGNLLTDPLIGAHSQVEWTRIINGLLG